MKPYGRKRAKNTCECCTTHSKQNKAKQKKHARNETKKVERAGLLKSRRHEKKGTD